MSQFFQGTTAGGLPPSVATTFDGNTGSAVPASNTINIVTDNSTIIVSASGDTLTIDFGLRNLLIGAEGTDITTGDFNVSLGSRSLESVTSGISNVAIGFQSSLEMTTGFSNVSIGQGSLDTATSASSNVAIGQSSLNTLVSGNSNVGVGVSSLLNIQSGTNNIALGVNSGSSYTFSDSSNISIGNNGLSGESNAIRIGTQGTGNGQQNKAFIAGVKGVTVVASSPVAVDTNGRLSDLDFGSTGQVLTSNGAGSSPTWQETGNVEGPIPATSSDNAIVRWDLTSGRIIQNSTAILGDTGNLSGIGSLSAAGSVTISRSTTSANIINLTNTSNTAGADSQIEIVVAGTSGGDCKINLSVTGVPGVQWHLGLDNSDDDAFIIGQGSTFGSDTEIRIDNAGIFQMQKGVSHNLTTTATSYNILVTDYFVGVTDNSVARTITLPSTSSVGQTYTVKDQAGTSGATPIIIDTAGAELIDGAATATINVNYGALRFYFDGTNYFII